MISLIVFIISCVKALTSSVVSKGSWTKFSVSTTKTPSRRASGFGGVIGAGI